MCLIITLFAAVIATIVWYLQLPNNHYKISTLVFMYWGAALMWIGDRFFCLIKAEPFIDFSINDTLLGFTVVISGLIGWVIIILMNSKKMKLLHI